MQCKVDIPDRPQTVKVAWTDPNHQIKACFMGKLTHIPAVLFTCFLALTASAQPIKIWDGGASGNWSKWVAQASSSACASH